MAAVSDDRRQPSAGDAAVEPPHPTTLARRVEAIIRGRVADGPGRRWVLLVSVTFFLALSVAAFWTLPSGARFRWWVVPLLVLVTTPLTVAANSAEFRIIGAINGHAIGWFAAARLTLVASIANLLPLPGGVVVRTEALHRRGSSYRHALGANAAAGLAWIGVGCLIIAALLVNEPKHRLAAGGLVLAALAALFGCLAILRRIGPSAPGSLFAQLMLVEAATVAISASRVFLAFKLIALSASPVQSVTLTASQIIAAAIGVFPSGLGLRELLSGAIGSAVGLDVGASVAATAADRVVSQLGVALLCVPLLLRGGLKTAVAEPRADLPSTDLP
jgi:hypothetical protein